MGCVQGCLAWLGLGQDEGELGSSHEERRPLLAPLTIASKNVLGKSNTISDDDVRTYQSVVDEAQA